MGIGDYSDHSLASIKMASPSYMVEQHHQFDVKSDAQSNHQEKEERRRWLDQAIRVAGNREVSGGEIVSMARMFQDYVDNGIKQGLPDDDED